MMRRIAYSLLTLLVILIAGVYWLTATQSGLNFVLEQTQKQLPALTIETAEGQLAGRLKMQDIHYAPEEGVKVHLRSLDLDWLPWALISGQLLMNQLHISGLEITEGQAESSEDSDSGLPEIAVPISINIRSLRVTDAWLNAADGSRTLLFDRLDTRFRMSQDRLSVADLNLNRPEFAFMLSGETRLSTPYPVNLNYGLTLYLPDIKPLSITGTVDGDRRQLNVHQQVGAPLASQQDITLSNILDNLSWRLESNSQLWELSDFNVDEKSRLMGMKISAGGDLERANINISGMLEHQDYPPVGMFSRFETTDFNNWRMNSDFHFSEERFVSLDGVFNDVMSSPHADMKLRWHNLSWPLENPGDTDLQSSGALQLAGELDNFTAGLEASLDVYQETVRLSGRLAGNMQALDIDSLTLKHQEGNINLQGQLAYADAFKYALNAQWQDLKVPDRFSEIGVISPRGNLQIDGENDHFRLRSRSDLSVDDVPLALDLRASSEETGLADIRLNASSGPGAVDVTANVDWRHDLAATAVIRLEQVDPSLVTPDWPGKLSGEFELDVADNADHPMAFKIKDLHIYGNLLGNNVDARANLQYQQTLRLENLDLTSGNSRLSASGQVGDEMALSFEIDAPALGDFHPDLTGELAGQGTLSGKTTEPTLVLDLSGSDIGYADVLTLAALEADGQVSFQRSQQNNLQLSFSNLQMADYQLDYLTADIKGQPDQHVLQLAAASADLTLTSRFAGGWDGEQWQGQLTQLDLQQAIAGNWQLVQPAELQLSTASQQMAGFCWQSGTDERLCLDMLRDSDRFQLQADLSALDINRLNVLTKDYAELDGALNAEIALQTEAGTPIGRLDMEIDSLIASPSAEMPEQQPVEFEQFAMQANFESDASQFSLIVAPDLAGFDPLRLTATSADLKTLMAAPLDTELSAQLQSHVDDLSALAFISPAFEELQGKLALDADISGTLNQPLAQGRLSLREGQVAVQDLGIVLRAIEADIDGNLQDGVSFLYRAESGDGTLEGDGQFTLDEQGWLMQTAFSGNHLEVMHLPEAYVVASPDLALTISPGNAKLTGDLVIPEADLAPLEFNSTVSRSQDVEIVGATEEKADRLVTDVDIRVVLGEKVQITGLGFNGRLTGDLAIEGDAGELLTGNGEITITDGIYEAYGQKLTVDNGKIRFSGAAIDNPELDIRAVRKGRDFTAGLHIQGPASAPQATLFSQPSMSQDEILSHILLGRSINSASGDDAAMLASAATSLGIRNGNLLGQDIANSFGLDEFKIGGDDADNAALQIGKYLSPKLYLGYGIGVFEPVSTVQLRYKLNKIWSLQAESGTESGVDLLYIFER